MAMTIPSYYLDLSSFSLEKLKNVFKSTRMLPSQKILQEQVDERFACIEQCGIKNLEQLKKALKSKSDVQSFAETTGLPEGYLTILRREVNSYHPKPIKLKDFPNINPEVTSKLEEIDIKNTVHLFPRVLTEEDREKLAQDTGTKAEDIIELTSLTDFARAKWVGPIFARLLVESGYGSIEELAGSNYLDVHDAIIRTNDRLGIYRGNLGLEDIKLWMENVVPDIPRVIRLPR